MPGIARFFAQPAVDWILDPETTNMELVARFE